MRQAFIFAIGLVACGGGGDGGGGISGSVVSGGGTPVPASGNVYALWLNDTGSGDFVFKHGEGTSTGATFDLDVPAPVPTGALLGGKFGLGFVVLVDPSIELEDGVVDEAALGAPLGIASQHALIFRADDTQTGDWPDQFPVGLSCGKCVFESDGFDSYEPVDCDQLEIQSGDPDPATTCNPT